MADVDVQFTVRVMNVSEAEREWLEDDPWGFLQAQGHLDRGELWVEDV